MPFAVQIDGQNPEALFGPGEMPRVVLSNADHAAYRFRWSLVAANRAQTEEKEATIAPNGRLILNLNELNLRQANIKPAWFSAGTLRDEVVDGILQLQPAVLSGMPPQPPKLLPLKLRFRFWSRYWQQGWNVALTGVLIFAGMFLSLVYRYMIPNTATRIKIRRQLAAMKRKVSGIDENLPTQPRTVLEATIESCKQNLRAVPSFSPAAASLLTEVQANATMCSAWIDCAYTVAEILAEAWLELQMGLPPTLMRMIDEKCANALRLFLSGFTKPEELQAMNDAAKDARKYLDAAKNGDPVPDFVDVLKKRLDLLKPALQSLQTSYPGYANLFSQAASLPTEISPENYRDMDIITTKVKLLAEYRDLALRVGATTFPPPAPAGNPLSAVERMGAHYAKFLAYVNTESYESLNTARVLLAEMEQDFYPQALIDELARNRDCVEILKVPSPVEPGVPVHYSLRFVRTALNHVAAVKEWSLVWKFIDDPATVKAKKSGYSLSRMLSWFRKPSDSIKAANPDAGVTKETVARTPGWDVYHRFKEQGEHQVSVEIFDIDGQQILKDPLSSPVATKPNGSVKRRWFKPKTWTGEARIEALRMSFVFLIAICGVFTTARAKVEQAGIFEGAAALVAIGFAADIVKSAISNNPGEK